MNIIEEGHIYVLTNHSPNGGNPTSQTITFLNNKKGQEHDGIINQDLIRVIIDRLKCLDNEVHWELNKEIIYHLRMAIALHEARAIIRKVELRKINAEEVIIGPDGHFDLDFQQRIHMSNAAKEYEDNEYLRKSNKND